MSDSTYPSTETTNSEEAGYYEAPPQETEIAASTAPLFQSASTSADGTKVILNYDQNLSDISAAQSDYLVTVAGNPATITGVDISGSSVELSVAVPIESDQHILVSYSDPSPGDDVNAVQDTVGNDVASLIERLVTNNSTAKNGLFPKQGGGIASDYILGISKLGATNSIVTGGFNNSATFGSTTINSAGGKDIFVGKLDDKGNYEWIKRAGGTGDDLSLIHI